MRNPGSAEPLSGPRVKMNRVAGACEFNRLSDCCRTNDMNGLRDAAALCTLEHVGEAPVRDEAVNLDGVYADMPGKAQDLAGIFEVGHKHSRHKRRCAARQVTCFIR